MKFITALTVAFVAVLMIVPVASAADGVESAVVDGIDSGSLPVDSTQLSQKGLFPTKCKWVYAQVTYKSVLGKVLYRMYQGVNFCYNGSKITKVWAYQRGVKNIDPIWNFIGWTLLEKAGGGGTCCYSAKTKAHFQSCWNPLLSCVNRYPWLKVSLSRSGSVTWTGHN